MKQPSVREIKKQHWKEIIIACNNSGMCKKEWCHEHGIREKSFYYYQKILREEALENAIEEHPSPAFADITSQLNPATTSLANIQVPVFEKHPDLVIRKGELVLEVSNTISPELLQIIGGILNAQ